MFIKNNRKLLLFSLFALILLLCDQAIAAPGGRIVQVVVETWWGRLISIVLFIILFPLIVRYYYLEKKAIKQAHSAISQLAQLNEAFRWSAINERVHAVVSHVYSAWSKGDMEKAMDWMTSWYWQNQKLTVLESWEEDGLVNYCRLNGINYIKPLLVEYNENEQGDGEGTRISLLVEVNLIDYLAKKDSGEIIVGDKKDKDYESIWTIILEDGKWKLSLIEDSYLSEDYAKMKNELGIAVEHVNSGFKFKRKTV